jgi:nicotinamide-nucleotide amidase
MEDTFTAQATEVLERCRRRGWRLATAESCTGGLIVGALTEIAGSSDVVEAGFVTYSNEAKHSMLGVPMPLFESVGAVSREVATAMAEGVLARLPQVALSVAVTGIAGPGGATPGKPVGLVHFALAHRGRPTETRHEVFPGDRSAVRHATVALALVMLSEAAGS